MSLEFGVEAVGEEGIGEGSVEGVNGEGAVSGEGFEAVVGEGGTFAAREGQEVTGGVGGGRQPVAGASGAQEGEVEGDIIADKQVFANKGKEVGESLLGRPSFVGEGGVVKADEGGDVVREGGGLADKGGEGLGGLAVLDLDGAVLDDVGDGGVEPGGFEVDGDVVPAVACVLGLGALGDEALCGLAEAGAKRLAFRERGGEGTAHEGDAVEIHRLPRCIVDAEGEALLAVGGVDEGGAPVFEV